MAAIAMAGILLQGVLAAFGPSENPREPRVKLSFDEQFAKRVLPAVRWRQQIFDEALHEQHLQCRQHLERAFQRDQR
jgi:hypothetical protein